jgi:hypothetical protein
MQRSSSSTIVGPRSIAFGFFSLGSASRDAAPVFDFLAVRVHDHPLCDGRVAGDLQFRRLLDVDQTDAAQTSRPELGMVAIDRNVGIDGLRGFDQERSFGNGDREAVDRQGDRLIAHDTILSRAKWLRSMSPGA